MEPNEPRKQARSRHAQHPTLLKSTLLNQAFTLAQENPQQTKDSAQSRLEGAISVDSGPAATHKLSGMSLLGLFDLSTSLALAIAAAIPVASEIPTQVTTEVVLATPAELQILSLCQHTPASLLALWYFYGPHIVAFNSSYFGLPALELQTLLPSVSALDSDTKTGRESPLSLSLCDSHFIEPSTPDIQVVYS